MNNTPVQFFSRIIANDRIAEGFYELTLAWDSRAPVPAPGQFLTIRIGSGAAPLLRRPFAFAGFDAESSAAAVIYQVRGAGTGLLAAARPGEELDVIGPLGTPFAVNDNGEIAGQARNDSGSDIPPKRVIAAGGIGLGPMIFLASSLKSRGVPADFIFGCRNKGFVPETKRFTGVAPRICTDDGSMGFRGTAADYINANVSLDTNTTIYACGPLPMLKAVNALARSSGARCLASLEAVMACGVGACMGCAVPVAGGGYARVCREGPVFDGGDIRWELM